MRKRYMYRIFIQISYEKCIAICVRNCASCKTLQIYRVVTVKIGRIYGDWEGE